jgi:hypothetical protein
VSDIVELLQTRLNTPFRITELMNAAADEIERLRSILASSCDANVEHVKGLTEKWEGQRFILTSDIVALRARVAELEEALREIESATVDDQPTCCGHGVRTGYEDIECCGSPEYGVDRARRIARAAIAKHEEK